MGEDVAAVRWERLPQPLHWLSSGGIRANPEEPVSKLHWPSGVDEVLPVHSSSFPESASARISSSRDESLLQDRRQSQFFQWSGLCGQDSDGLVGVDGVLVALVDDGDLRTSSLA